MSNHVLNGPLPTHTFSRLCCLAAATLSYRQGGLLLLLPLLLPLLLLLLLLVLKDVFRTSTATSSCPIGVPSTRELRETRCSARLSSYCVDHSSSQTPSAAQTCHCSRAALLNRLSAFSSVSSPNCLLPHNVLVLACQSLYAPHG